MNEVEKIANERLNYEYVKYYGEPILRFKPNIKKEDYCLSQSVPQEIAVFKIKHSTKVMTVTRYCNDWVVNTGERLAIDFLLAEFKRLEDEVERLKGYLRDINVMTKVSCDANELRRKSDEMLDKFGLLEEFEPQQTEDNTFTPDYTLKLGFEYLEEIIECRAITKDDLKLAVLKCEPQQTEDE